VEPWLWRVPALPSFVPFPLAAGAYTERMTFAERLCNALTLLDWSAWPRLDYIEDSFVDRYLPGQTYGSLAAQSLLWLVDTDTVIDYPRPVMPNEVIQLARVKTAHVQRCSVHSAREHGHCVPSVPERGPS